MKVALVFYSFTGNTKRAVLFLRDIFKSKNRECNLIELKPLKETTAFFKQCWEAFLKRKPELISNREEYDLGEYNLIIIASPVWAFAISPAMRSYLKKVEGLDNKKVACFLTFGSGTGADRALREIENILRKKRAEVIFSKKLSGNRTRDRNYLEKEFGSLITSNF